MLSRWSMVAIIAIIVAISLQLVASASHWTIEDEWQHYTTPELELKASNDVELWFDNFIDHFNTLDTRTYKQRYYINDEFWNPKDKNAPVFLYLGCEGPLASKWVHDGFMYTAARQHGAKMIALEHRFYGKSHPFDYDTSVENLRYLTTDLALADMAHFISSFVKTDGYRPWITFGGSYGSGLASWARLKYPGLVHGAVGASGPIYPLIDFPQYMEVADAAFVYYGKEECRNRIAQGTLALKEIIDTAQDTKLATISKSLRLCTPLTRDMLSNPLHKQAFWGQLSDNFAGVVQYNHETRGTGVLSVYDVCDIYSNPNRQPLDALIELVQKMATQQGESCIDWTYDDMVKDLKRINVGERDNMRQWIWQTCTEYGYYQTTTTIKTFADLFEVDFFLQQCQDAFGKEYTLEHLETLSTRIIDAYQAGPQRDGLPGYRFRGSNVIFTNGNIDPWHALAYLTSEDQDKFAQDNHLYHHMVMGTSHCQPLYGDLPSDPQTLKDARKAMLAQLKTIVSLWLP